MHDGRANFAIRKMIGKFRGGFQLIGADPPAQHRCADVGISRLFLGVHTHMVAIGVFRDLFGLRGVQRKSNAQVQFAEEGFRRPPVIQEKKLQTRPIAALAKNFALAENLSDAPHDLYRLMRHTKAFKRTAKCGSVERPPATRNENPVSIAPRRRRVVAVSATSLISGYEHHRWQPVIETLNLRGRL